MFKKWINIHKIPIILAV